MKKFFMLTTLLCAMGCAVVGGALIAKCINNKHQKEKTTRTGGEVKVTKVYKCIVKRDEAINFSDGYCKNCGCHISDHDNEAR